MHPNWKNQEHHHLCPLVNTLSFWKKMSLVFESPRAIQINKQLKKTRTDAIPLKKATLYYNINMDSTCIYTCAVCSSSIYWFWLPLWYLQTLLTMHVQCKQGLWMFVVKRIHDCANYECRICWWKTIYLILWLFFVFFTGERKICSITCDFFFSVSDWIFERSWPRLFKNFSAFQILSSIVICY